MDSEGAGVVSCSVSRLPCSAEDVQLRRVNVPAHLWMRSHRLTDLIQSLWITPPPPHLEPIVTDGIETGSTDRSLMTK